MMKTIFLSILWALTIRPAWIRIWWVALKEFSLMSLYNNTLVQRKGSLNEGILWIIFTAESSGMEGGRLVPGTIHLTNNLFVLDGITPYGQLIDPAFDTNNNLVVSYSGTTDDDYVDLGFADIAGTDPADFDLVDADSPAVDAGADIGGNMTDFFNRVRPSSGAPDIGAMESGSSQAECLPRFPVH